MIITKERKIKKTKGKGEMRRRKLGMRRGKHVV